MVQDNLPERPQKRSRDDTPSLDTQDGSSLAPTNSPVKRARDSALWLEDGNIVLIVQDVEFRVYAGLLIKHSVVFGDMLSLFRENPSSEPVQLSEDSEVLLFLLYFIQPSAI